MLNNNAVKKPETAKSSINLSANNIIMALITKRNKPRVTMVAGSVKKINKGLTNIFNKEIIRATIIADTQPATSTPGKILAKTMTAKAVNKIFKKLFMLLNFKFLKSLRNHVINIILLKVHQ